MKRNLIESNFTHSTSPHIPGRLCTVSSSTLLYTDHSKGQPDVHMLDCSTSIPELEGKKANARLQHSS